MNTKQILLSLLIVSLVFGVSACNTKKDDTGTGGGWIGGTTGLLISFSEGEPPESVHTGGDEPFAATVRLENKGEQTILAQDVTVSLRGFDPGDFGTTLTDLSKNAPEDLLKTTKDPDTDTPIETSPVYVEFDLNYVSDIGGARHTFDVLAEVCYAYATYASAELCIKENLLDTTDDKLCKVIGSKSVSNSGAPLQITSFEEFTSGKDAVRFLFMVEKMANGEVYTVDSTCNNERVDEDKVYVKVDTGIDGVECSTLGGSNEGVVKLSEGKKQISCTQRLSENDKSDKVKLVNFELGYDFQDSVTQEITVISQLDY